MKPRWHRSRPSDLTRRVLPQDLERADARLLRVLDRDFRVAQERAGTWLVCAPGCFECCVGPFPVTRLDVWRLRRGLAELEHREPKRAARVVARARRAVARLTPAYPGNPATGRLAEDVPALDAFFEGHASLPCPALDLDSGRCELYEARPVSCRTYGPPVRFGDERAAPCRLCFDGAPPETVEACRIEPDAEGLEDAILAGIGGGDDDWETLIAFALTGGPQPVVRDALKR